MSGPTTEALVTLGRRYVRSAPGTYGKARLADRWLNPHLREQPRRRVTETAVGAHFAVDTQDLIQRYLYLFGVWEPRMTQWLRNRLAPGDTFIDVGANIGYFSVLASQLVGPRGRVAAIEASEAFTARLAQNARLNRCRNIRTVHTAVSDKQQTLTFILASSANMGANSIVPYDGPAESTFDIEAYPLPEILDADEIATARVIKVDVEGAEGSVVRGMAPMLGRLRPDAEITVEVTPERMEQLGDSVEELLDTMRGAGFHVYRLANEYAAASYPTALRGASAVPVRWRGPVTGESDLIFSRVDAETLP
ncbi:FkbM family methyltransferase [Actinacidiphila sp. DG2A-62]|uniref:FkbM family methyltransferase n=1 Tax=Actinacidiphila sp. DG2A-62 TaxID=3108821 RepID=UPI002DBACA79|nr:FkbM family methyltransferase [Actinacidiphila sp. DG2A-62]MEC3997223.1 FkbM family methyltransferase [Actinacidiphila sp. DG2A-62]